MSDSDINSGRYTLHMSRRAVNNSYLLLSRETNILSHYYYARP